MVALRRWHFESDDKMETRMYDSWASELSDDTSFHVSAFG